MLVFWAYPGEINQTQRVPHLKTGTTMIKEEHLKAKIKDAVYVVMPDGRTTICQIQLINGFSVIGTSSCINKNDFNLTLGREIAYKNAFEKIWELEGYLAMNSKSLIALPVVDPMKKPRKYKYGIKADGTPRKKPGRKPAKKAPEIAPAIEAPVLTEVVTA
jgi:hypothetical protein